MLPVKSRNEIIHKGRIFSLIRENITLSNGTSFQMEIIRHPGAAAVIPLLPDRQIVLIRQYRYTLGEYIWEIPAGTLEAGENPTQCAHRELVEETGFAAEELIELGVIALAPGYSDEKIHIFLARNLTPGQQHLDENEIVNVSIKKIEHIFQMIAKGQITDSKTIAAMFMLQQYSSAPA